MANRAIAHADAARDAARFSDAAALYDFALALTPGRRAIHVQAGHMYKEARDFRAAERHYLAALAQGEPDADLELQAGHFFKTIDRLELAVWHYRRARSLAPGWDEPLRELTALEERQRRIVAPGEHGDDAPVPELVPRPLRPRAHPPLDEIRFGQLGGRRHRLADEDLPNLRGIEAIRGTCYSDGYIIAATLLLDDVVIHRADIRSVRVEDRPLFKAVFNLWIDLSSVQVGVHRLEIVLADRDGRTRRRTDRVFVDRPARDAIAQRSDGAVVRLSANDDLERDIRSQRSVIRPASTMTMPVPERILVLRTDQLGDLVISIPALRRLRCLFPKALIVGLVTDANIDLARCSGLFDEVLRADFPDDMDRRQRIMTAERQRELQTLLAEYHFDVAIDLAASGVSRSLLKLAGARFTFGFDDADRPWMDGGLAGNIRDPVNGKEASPQSGRILALVERLGSLVRTGAEIVRRPDLDRSVLVSCGLSAGDGYVVLHAGARVAFSRWDKFDALARELLQRYALKVVVLAEKTDRQPVTANEAAANSRLVWIDRRLSFDELDALLSFCSLFVGNDSGPKHLAALRGAPVIGLHCARINWNEWGQEQTGVSISRRVPCAGCALFHDADQCGKEHACITDIRVEEVLDAVDMLVPGLPRA